MRDERKEWKVFQTDVLDLLRQYRGFFDFFEIVGSLSDNSRPDAFARITREEKKEVWIIDAKNKQEIGEEDEQRMQKYIDQVARNPTDVGLEVSELSEHEIRPLIISRSKTDSEYECVEFRRLHQFLQKELIYTDTDRIVRDVAKMAERRELSQSQARLLNNSLKPFRQRLEKTLEDLRELETEFTGLKLHTPPFNSLDFSTPSDAVLKQEAREGVFLINIPYSPGEAQKSEKKARNIESGIEEKAYYISVHSFDVETEFKCAPENLRDRLKRELGVLSPRELADIFNPKFQTEKEVEDRKIVLKSSELGFYLKVESRKDTEHSIEAALTSEAISKLKDRTTNTRTEFGKFQNGKWTQELEIEKDLTVKHQQEDSLEEYRKKVENIFQAAINPVYSRKVAKKIQK